MKKLLSIILCVITMFSVLTLTGCKDKNAVGKEWEVKEYVMGGYAVTPLVGFTVNRNGGKIQDVWVNIREIKGENADYEKHCIECSQGQTDCCRCHGNIRGKLDANKFR